MNTSRLRKLYADEHHELVQLVATLTPAQLATPSLCAGWSVADVIDHLNGWEYLLGYDHATEYPRCLLRYATLYLRSRASIDRMNVAIGQQQARSERCHRRHVFDRTAPGAQLAELVVHHQDIRRALDIPRVIAAERLIAALDGVRRLPGIDVKKQLKACTWRATDLDWVAGDGAALVEAPGDEILLRLAGRPSAAIANTTPP